MCVVSMIGDHYRDKFWPPSYPFVPSSPSLPDIAHRIDNNQTVTRDEFDALKKEIEEMQKLLDRAREYDKRMKQPHCEDGDKWELLRKIAEKVGVDLET